MNIIGISSHFHDSACCVLKDGLLVAAAEEERYSKVKHDSSIPTRAFRHCLKMAGLTLSDVDCIAYYERPDLKLARQIWMLLTGPLTQERLKSIRLSAQKPEQDIRDHLGYSGPIEFVSHHESHAASSFFYSGFDESAILTVDGVGEWSTLTMGRGKSTGVEILESVEFPDSIGLLYSALTSYLGFDVNDAEYKVMGLAPYGKPRFTKQVSALIKSSEMGQFRLNEKFFSFATSSSRMYSDELVELFGLPPRLAESEIGQDYMDIAHSLQKVLEDVLLEKARYLHSLVPSENLCMAGGVALNCVANGVILEKGPFQRLFVQPAADDGGGALGAAAVGYLRRTGSRISNQKMKSAFWGDSYGDSEVGALMSSSGIPARDFTGQQEKLIDFACDKLSEGAVLGWHQGRMEFGPRALGNRSIIADPRRSDMRDKINAVVKLREQFRPFAPACLWEVAKDHFDIDHESPFMLETCQVKSSLELPSITHVDGSARLQTVTQESNPLFYKLLTRFYERTGCPILLNTSFNLRGEPMVNSPADALWTFVRCQMDYLFVGSYAVDRQMIPKYWTELATEWLSSRRQRSSTHDRSQGEVSHDVYTFF